MSDPSRAAAEAAFGAPAGPSRAPSRAGTWVGAVIIAAAIAGAIAWFVLGLTGMTDAVDDLERVSIPAGGGAVELTEGRRAVYYETNQGDSENVPGLRITVVRESDQRALEVGDHSGTVTYSFGGHSGTSVAGLDVPRSGRHTVTVTATGPVPGDAELAIGPGVGGRIVRAILGGFAIAFLGIAVGVVLIVRTEGRRRRQARRGVTGAGNGPGRPV
jgi:hypothetical protein